MARRKYKYKHILRVKLLEHLTNNELNETFDRVIPTKYSYIESKEDRILIRFLTNSNNQYDLEFIYSTESPSIKLNDTTLGKIIGINKENPFSPTVVPTINIGFTLTDTNNNVNYEDKSNLHEQYEVFGRIAFICKDMLKYLDKFKVFVIGGTNTIKDKIYSNIINNLFSDVFTIYYGESEYHDGVSIFLIKK